MGKPDIPSRFSFGRKECQALSSDQKGTKQAPSRVGAELGQSRSQSYGQSRDGLTTIDVLLNTLFILTKDNM